MGKTGPVPFGSGADARPRYLEWFGLDSLTIGGYAMLVSELQHLPSPDAPSSVASAESAEGWGRLLAREVAAVLEQYPDADPEDVRRTLI
ncbi:MAG TPA: hypothetical protein VGR78_05810 [Verrucomicrobiae bacterium]|jgi:hypothetical protein|nr:hypothetical protein [Verrucomicrobiae bacterium]